MPTLIGTKTKISTKTAVALVAGALILAAAAAGGISLRNKSGNSFFGTQGYGPSRSYLEVKFLTRNGFITAQPGDTSVNLGRYRLRAVGSDVAISDFNIPMLVQDIVSSTPFALGTDGPVNATDHLTNCALKDFPSGTTISGPVFPPPGTGMTPTVMQFDDDFTLAAGQTMKLQLFCDMTLAPPNGLNDAFAVDIGLPNNIAAVEPPPSYAPITVTLPSPNGNPPRAYVLLTQ